MRKTKKRVRLACEECCRDDFDGITIADLRKLKRKNSGWTGISREQTYEQACKTYDDPSDEPKRYSALDWWTHIGLCPDCQPKEQK